MVHVVITGGAGFLGARLARKLLASETLTRLTLADRVPPPADLASDPRVTAVTGDLVQTLSSPEGRETMLGGADTVFHLAAAVSGECEADFDLGLHANLRATEDLLAACRALGGGSGSPGSPGSGQPGPVVVYASSLAVFGAPDGYPPGAGVDDDTMPTPLTSYGTQKVLGEYLLADYTRRGILRGRALRLVTVSVRPGKPNAAASGFLSGIIREPLSGQRAACPVSPDTEVGLASPSKAVAGLLRAARASDAEWGGLTAVNLPALTVTVREMVAALSRVAGPEAASLVDWVPDPAVARIVKSWPARVTSARAARLGLEPDPDFDSVVRAHIKSVT